MLAFDTLYDQLLEINRATFEEGAFEVAYHALAAALHCARHLSEEQRLAEVERRAHEQGEWIDSHRPTDTASTQAAAQHGNPAIFASLSRQAHTTQIIVRQEQLKESLNQLVDHERALLDEANTPPPTDPNE